MNVSTIEKYKNLFRIDGVTTQDYSEHLIGEKPIAYSDTEKVYFTRREIVGEIDVTNPLLKGLPMAIISGRAYLFFKHQIEREKADRLLSSLMERIGLQSEKTVCELPFFKGADSDDIVTYPKADFLYDALDEMAKLKRNYNDIVDWMNSLQYRDAPPCVQGYLLSKPRTDIDCCAPYFKAAKLGEEYCKMSKKAQDFHDKNSVPYECHKSPLKDYCVAGECSKRKYRPGGGYVPSLNFGKMKRYDSGKSCFYVWKINGEDVRFDSEDEMIRQTMFAKVCMRSLGLYPRVMSAGSWTDILNCGLRSLDVVPQSKIDKVLPDRLRHILLNSKSILIMDTRYNYAKLVQGYVFVNPATFVMVLDGLGFCAYVNANFKGLGMDSFEQFTRALRHLGFKKGVRSAGGDKKDVWTIRLADFLPDEKEWCKFVKMVAKDTPWEDNINAIVDENAESVGMELISEDDKRAIEQDALYYIDTEKEEDDEGSRN